MILNACPPKAKGLVGGQVDHVEEDRWSKNFSLGVMMKIANDNKPKMQRKLLMALGVGVSVTTFFGCLVAAVPLVINAVKGSNSSTATVLIDRDAATVYAEAVKAVSQRGYTQITKRDDTNYILDGTRKGKNATLKVTPVGSDRSRVIITIENDKDAKDINEAVAALKQTCNQLGFECQEPGS